jgi:hypothetical protein
MLMEHVHCMKAAQPRTEKWAFWDFELAETVAHPTIGIPAVLDL